jgi:hypothetical protein
MIHFAGKPDCAIRTKDGTGHVSRVTDLDEFREWWRSLPAAYCSECANEPTPRTDSDRYAELRKLVEAYQNAKCYEDDEPLKALREWSHH